MTLEMTLFYKPVPRVMHGKKNSCRLKCLNKLCIIVCRKLQKNKLLKHFNFLSIFKVTGCCCWFTSVIYFHIGIIEIAIVRGTATEGRRTFISYACASCLRIARLEILSRDSNPISFYATTTIEIQKQCKVNSRK